jgi:hypothetical protein
MTTQHIFFSFLVVCKSHSTNFLCSERFCHDKMYLILL